MASTPKEHRPLGEVQRDILRSLQGHKHWYSNCGWVWDGNKSTERRLDVLVGRGLVEKKVLTLGEMSFGEPTGTSFQQECYVLTRAGHKAADDALQQLRAQQQARRAAR